VFNLKTVNIVNDCAHVMQDLIPHLQEDFSINRVERSRGLYSKTLGLFNKIRKLDGGLNHVNYALQDAWLVSHLKRLDVLHCHGSDIRVALKSRRWGWMVRSNLKRAEQVLVSTPDLCGLLDGVVDCSWLPNPVDTQRFTPAYKQYHRPRALYFEKWYEQLPQTVRQACYELWARSGSGLHGAPVRFCGPFRGH
jgi:hypothetical protein